MTGTPRLGDQLPGMREQTRDLVAKLTALADRYDDLPEALHPVRAEERSASIALMRSAAASGRRLLDPDAQGDGRQP